AWAPSYTQASSRGCRAPGGGGGAPRAGPSPAVGPTSPGRAWVTGLGQYMVDPSDPYPAGFEF
ncbi:proline racemase family protein, partial [Streptomyces scopuliridis]|uniref:proline racemase family protein n=1 Tax=Streptomyces scopuliridis TaxID=452529 RepID=UPI003696282E